MTENHIFSLLTAGKPEYESARRMQTAQTKYINSAMEFKMPLEQFFEEGNALAIFGSVVYMPESASDVDFTMFTHGGDNPLECAPEHSDEVRAFLSQHVDLKNKHLDFSGRVNFNPYDIDDLPKEDDRLCGYYLVGRFFPDAEFLEQHYRNLFGETWLTEVWRRFAEHVAGFQPREERMEKRHKDLPLLLAATEKLARGNPSLKRVMLRYGRDYERISHPAESDEVLGYDPRTAQMVREFAYDVESLLLKQVA